MTKPTTNQVSKKEKSIDSTEQLEEELDVLLGEYKMTGDDTRKVNILELFDQAILNERDRIMKIIKQNKVKFRFNSGIDDKQYSKKLAADNRSDYRNDLLDDIKKQLTKTTPKRQY